MGAESLNVLQSEVVVANLALIAFTPGELCAGECFIHLGLSQAIASIWVE